MGKEIEDLWNLLLEVKKLLDEANCPFFPFHGTLLGFIRDGGIIVDDDDIDLGVMEENINLLDNVYRLAEKKNFIPQWEISSSLGLKILVIRKGVEWLPHVAIFVCYRYKGRVFSKLGNSVESYSDKHFDSFDNIKVNGIDFIVPLYTEELLFSIYGKDWNEHIPHEEYRSKYHRPAIDDKLLMELNDNVI